jgi:predicted lipoprotein with Yx(FWY)xxD motif
MRRTTVLLVLAAAALAAGGAALAASLPQGKLTVRSTALGRVLADGRGHTLYLFEHDSTARSSCYGQCAAAWPPFLTATRPVAGAGVAKGLLGTTKRRDGKLQVTYAGHPLYFFVQDTRAGQTTGEGIDHFGGSWYALSATGKKIDRDDSSGDAAATTPAATTTDSGYGGDYGKGY